MFNFDLTQEIKAFLLDKSVTSEYQIIQHLKTVGRFPERMSLTDNLTLFRCHFLVFNALYRLKSDKAFCSEYELDISPLVIQLKKTAPTSAHNASQNMSNETVRVDPLKAFYLDYQQLNQTDANEVELLLKRFWQAFLSPTEKREALKTLELDEPVDFNTIKKQYRRLAMKHHPDRGGCQQKLVSINQAMQCLELYYSSP